MYMWANLGELSHGLDARLMHAHLGTRSGTSASNISTYTYAKGGHGYSSEKGVVVIHR